MKNLKQKYGSAILVTFIVLISSCNMSNKTIADKTKNDMIADISSGEGKFIISAPVVKKQFIKKKAHD